MSVAETLKRPHLATYTLLESEELWLLKAGGHLPLQRQVTGKKHRDTAGIIAKNCMETGS